MESREEAKAKIDAILERVADRQGFMKPLGRQGAIYWMHAAVESLYNLGYLRDDPKLPLDSLQQDYEKIDFP